jgi:hypothetical protein
MCSAIDTSINRRVKGAEACPCLFSVQRLPLNSLAISAAAVVSAFFVRLA